MTIAQQLEARLFELADPAVTWVQHPPSWPGEQCLLIRRLGVPDRPVAVFEHKVYEWLTEFIRDYSDSSQTAGWWKDRTAQSREDVLWMLQEAIDEAKWEGV